MHEQGINIVVCVIPPEGSEHDDIKIMAELDIGIMTQCIKSDTFANGTEFRETFLLNINAKLDGINQKLSTAPILKDFDTAPIMFIGAYLTSSGQQNAPRYENLEGFYDDSNPSVCELTKNNDSSLFGSIFV